MKKGTPTQTPEQLEQLSARIGYAFRDQALIRLALRHPSLGQTNNQRLEFLGDAVLQLIISERLYARYPHYQEGALTQLRQKLVCEGALADVARSIHLDEYIVADHGSEISGVLRQDGALSDAMEAVLAAVYLDGGFERTKDVVDRLWPPEASLTEDAKSRLQEIEQSRNHTAPTYMMIEENGPAHDRSFVARVTLADGRHADGQGHSKKRAEQEAAANMLITLEEKSKA